MTRPGRTSMTAVTSNSTEQTRLAGAALAAKASAGTIYALIGPLGAGKTEFVRGFTGSLLPGAAVSSPTFALLNIYETPRFPVYHFDFFRLKDRRELVEIGFDDFLFGSGVCLIEWADLFMDELPPDLTQVIRFEDNGGQVRTISIVE